MIQNSITPRGKHYWPFEVDRIFHQHKHLDIDVRIFWLVCDRTVWHRRFLHKRGKDTGDWWTLCSGSSVSKELEIHRVYACKRLKFLREIGLLKASGTTNNRSYTPVFYDQIRTRFLEDRRWVRKPVPVTPAPEPISVEDSEEIKAIITSNWDIVKKKVLYRDNIIKSKRPDISESAFRIKPGFIPGSCFN